MKETTQPVDKKQECLKELNDVLVKFGFNLMPTFQLVDAPKPEEPTEPVTEEND